MTATPPVAHAPGPMHAPAARGRALPRAAIGTVPILWNNVDLPHMAEPVSADAVLDSIARAGYAGTQLGSGFAEGTLLREALATRGLRLAEVYASLPVTRDGPTAAALDEGRARLARLHDGGGEVLVAALDGTPERSAVSGRAAAPDAPRLTEPGWRALAATLERLAEESLRLGHQLAFHAHTGTFVETPDELERLLAETDPELVKVCLDVGHHTVGGGDPVAALRTLGARVTHVHLKDVAPAPLERLRSGRITGFEEALHERIFTELGNGVLDIPGIVDALVARDYAGWLMVEQDTTWLLPDESAAIGRRVLDYELQRAAERAGAGGGAAKA